MNILRAYGIPARIVQSISDVCDNTSAKVLTPDGETDTVPILAGVLEGDTLAPYLFIIVLDYALRRAITGKEEQNRSMEEQTGQGSNTDGLRLRR